MSDDVAIGLRPVDRVGSLPASQAAAVAMRELLETVQANIDGGTAGDRIAKFKRIYDTWPTQPKLDAPAASISTDEDDDDLEMAAWIEESADRALGAALMARDCTGDMQVDIWAADPNERNGFMAAITALFMGEECADNEDTARANFVEWPMPKQAIPRPWRERGAELELIVRLVLQKNPKTVDDADAAERGEYRAMFTVGWSTRSLTAKRAHWIDQIAIRQPTLEDPDCAKRDACE